MRRERRLVQRERLLVGARQAQRVRERHLEVRALLGGGGGRLREAVAGEAGGEARWIAVGQRFIGRQPLRQPDQHVARA